MRFVLWLGVLFVSAVLVSSCDFSGEGVVLTDPPLVGESGGAVASLPRRVGTFVLSSTLVPSSVIVEDIVVTSTVVPSQVLTITPGPWEYVVRVGDTLGYIIQLSPYNYSVYDRSVIDRIVQINDNIVSADVLPSPGEVVLIPRPTVGSVLVEDDILGDVVVLDVTADSSSVGSGVGCHTVREGETVVDIVEQYGGMTLENLSQLNGEVSFFGCNFEEPGGGVNCVPIIQPDQCVYVLLPTPTVTLSPTASGGETSTPTLVFRAPYMISPVEGASVSGGGVRLVWEGVGVLAEGEVYLVQVFDMTTGSSWADITRSNAMVIDDRIRPTNGQSHIISWTVGVASQNIDGLYALVGESMPPREFTWHP